MAGKPEYPAKILQLRKALGMTQAEFGKLFAGKRPETVAGPMAVSTWERGKHPPSAENYMRMGNMAPPELAIFFYHGAGLDIDAVERALDARWVGTTAEKRLLRPGNPEKHATQ